MTIFETNISFSKNVIMGASLERRARGNCPRCTHTP